MVRPSYPRDQSSCDHVPPPSINITGSFFVCGINFIGITGKIGNVVTGNNSRRINCHGITGSLAGSYRGRPMITGNIGNAITRKYSGGSNLEQLPENR